MSGIDNLLRTMTDSTFFRQRAFRSFLFQLLESGDQSRRQFVYHARTIVLSQFLANSFFRLTPIKPFA